MVTSKSHKGAKETSKGGPVVHSGPVPSAAPGVARLAPGGPAESAKPESDVPAEKGPVVHFGPVPSPSPGVARPAPGGPAESAKSESHVSAEKGPVMHFGPVR